MRSNAAKKKNIQLYVLGLLYFDDDTQKAIILSRKELSKIGWLFAAKMSSDLKPDEEDDTYFKVKLSDHHNSLAFRNFIGTELAGVVTEIQFGYYHHRAIFRFTLHENTKLHVIRAIRAQLYQLVREKCFDHFIEYPLIDHDTSKDLRTQLRLAYIYSYCLILVPNGLKRIYAEQQRVRKEGYDDIFTTRSTTFGLYLHERRLFRPKKHYFRISVPSMVIYADGEWPRQDLLDSIVDAIYYGGLYQKIKVDLLNVQHANQVFVSSDTWTNDRLLSVVKILNESVIASEMTDISTHMRRLAVITILAAILLPVILSLLLRLW